MKEHIHLFTPVSIEHIENHYLCLNEKYPHWSEVYCSVTGVFHDNTGTKITHVLDLSKLTTKLRAEELARDAFREGDGIYRTKENL